MSEWWYELEYRLLLEVCPLSGSPPSGAKLDELTRRLNHPRGSIIAEWNDARGYCKGNKTAASEALMAYLDRE